VKDLIEENEYLETQLILLKAKRYGKSSEKLTYNGPVKLEQRSGI
jgi:hypothetical protein